MSEYVIIKEAKFPEFGNRHIGSIKADVFDSPTCRYDIILGRDLLERLGLKMDFHNHRMTWGDRTIPMKSAVDFTPNQKQVDHYLNLYKRQEQRDSILFDSLSSNTNNAIILDRKYQAVTPEEVVQQLPHLNHHQQQALCTVF